MKLVRSPYFWAIVVVVSVVTYAYTARDRYRAAAILAGSKAPDFEYPTLDGGEIRLSDLEDKVVLVNIWATWCGPCRDEMPSLQRLYDALGDEEDFEILAVSVDAALGERDDTGNVGGDLGVFVHEFGLTFPILHDAAGEIRQTYQTTGVPESFVIARGGTIYKKWTGETEWDLPVNQAFIRRLLQS